VLKPGNPAIRNLMLRNRAAEIFQNRPCRWYSVSCLTFYEANKLILLLWVEISLMFGCLCAPGLLCALVPPRQRRSINSKYFCNFPVREIISNLTRFDIFNCFLNRVYGCGVMTRCSWDSS
jgi:hypothetical protein